MAAAEDAFQRREKLSEELIERGMSEIRFGIALHIREAMYGNIGATGRFDFTVIGAAVNETSRLESLCKEFGTSLVLSDAFVKSGHIANAVALGTRPLRGVSKEIELFTVPEHQPTPQGDG